MDATALLSQYQPLLLSQVKRWHDPKLMDWDDLLQEASACFLELVRDFRPDAGVFGSYVKTKLTWRLHNVIRAQRTRTGRVIGLEDLPTEPEDRHGTDNGLTATALRDALAALTPRQREVVIRYHIHGQSLESIARSMGIGVRAANGLKRRAEDQIRGR